LLTAILPLDIGPGQVNWVTGHSSAPQRGSGQKKTDPCPTLVVNHSGISQCYRHA